MPASAKFPPCATASTGATDGYCASVESRLDAEGAVELWSQAQNGSVFNHPAWWTAAIDVIGRDRPLMVLHVRRNDTTVALWPLWLKRLGARELMTRIVEPVGARMTDYCEPLLRRGHDRDELLRVLLAALMPALDAQTLFLWPKMPLALASGRTIESFAQELDLMCRAHLRPCPAMALPATYEQLEQRWSKSHRSDVRRQIRRLETAGKLELITAGSRDEVVALLPRLSAMHACNWRTRSGKVDPQAGRVTAFMTGLAATLPLDLIEASELCLDGVPLAAHFGFRRPTDLLWYKPTFDVSWASYAPGKVHIALAARRAIETGLQRIDFMQGNEPYKQLWSDLTTVTKSFALARPMAYPIWAWNTNVRKFAAEYRL
jgi:CelD/BcsL family acetyltransferase involved in cellulose biosynthesis